jgi:release factor glutamine methyltransferase
MMAVAAALAVPGDLRLEELPASARTLFVDSERAIADHVIFLADKPEESATTTVAALWHLAGGCALSVAAAGQRPLPVLDGEATDRLHALVAQRMAGVPLAHLTGRQRFMGLELLASPDALIPRQETEILARVAVERLRALVAEQGRALAVDVCTGSGNLALALAHHVPGATVWGSDLSPEAVALARRNISHLGLEQRVDFLESDLLNAFLDRPDCCGKVDLLTCNPPYISSGKVEMMAGEINDHEPRLAFDGGPLGIRILQRLINEAPSLLRPGGWLAFEVGLGQGRGLLQRLERHGAYVDLAQHVDEEGHTRVLTARSKPVADPD